MFWLEAVGFEGPLPVLSSQFHSKLFMVSPHLGGLGTKMSMNLLEKDNNLTESCVFQGTTHCLVLLFWLQARKRFRI